MKDINQFMFAANRRQKNSEKITKVDFSIRCTLDLVNPLFFLERGKKNNPVFKKRIPQQEFLAARWIKAGEGISQLELQQAHLRGECRPCLFHTRKAGRFPRIQKTEQWKVHGVQTVVFQGFVGDAKIPTQLYRDHNKPLKGSLLTNQDSMESGSFFFSRLIWGNCSFFWGGEAEAPSVVFLGDIGLWCHLGKDISDFLGGWYSLSLGCYPRKFNISPENG